MNFDPVAFVMGKAGVSRNVLSALMAGDGGGGVSGNLETSGWWTKGGLATVVGNTVNFPAGSTNTDLEIKPPTDIDANRRFHAGDVLELAIKVNEVSKRLYAQPSTNSNATLSIKNNVFVVDAGGMAHAESAGSDVLTWTFKGTVQYLRFSARSQSSSASSVQSANFEITGMKFNGNVIYGKV